MMLRFAIGLGLLTFFSGVFAYTPTKSYLIEEVNGLEVLIEGIHTHINNSANARIDEKVEAVDKCWTVKTADFQTQIQKTFSDVLQTIRYQLINLRSKIPNMSEDEIEQLSEELYVQTGGLLEQSEDAVDQFNQKVTRIHREVLALNTLDC